MASRNGSTIPDWKLKTTFLPDGQKTHIDEFGGMEVWAEAAELGSGSFGVVWKETCLYGRPLHSVRAVKRIEKRQLGYRDRELKALIEFSNPKRPEVCLSTPYFG